MPLLHDRAYPQATTTTTGFSAEILLAAGRDMVPQLCSMLTLHFFVWLLNKRSRWLGDSAARQVRGADRFSSLTQPFL